jgi:hypothetical protein
VTAITTTAISAPPPIDRSRWDRLVSDSPQGSVFARSAFLDALGLDWSVVEVEGAAALLLRDRAGDVVAAPMPFTSYQGVLLSKESGEAPPHRRGRLVVEQVEQLLERLRAERRLSWCLHHSLTDIRAFSWFNYHAPEHGQFRIAIRYTGLIEVDRAAGLDSVLSRSRSVRRQEYRKGRDRFRVEPSEDVMGLDRLHERTFARQGLTRPPREVELLRAIATAAIRDGFGELMMAVDHDGSPAAAVLFLHDHDTAYYLVSAADPDYRATGVSTLLFLSGIERAIERGIFRIDVVGMNSPSRGDFKTSFGAVPVPYYQVHWERP